MNEHELEQAILAEEARLHKLTLKELEMAKTKKLEFFVPTPAQLPFFEHADRKRRVAMCGNRWGKSTAGIVEDCCWLLGERPFFAKGDKRRRLGIPAKGVKLLLIGADWDKLNEVFTSEELVGDERGKLFEFLPAKHIVSVDKNRSGHVYRVVVENIIDGMARRASIWFDTVKSFQQDGLALESSDWDAIHVDEPIPEAMWKAASRGLVDRNGSSWWLLTPLCYPWMNKAANEGVRNSPQHWYYMKGSMRENVTLSKQAIDFYLDGLRDDERKCRESGLPLSSGRLVYPYFDRDKHVAKEMPPGWLAWNRPPFDYTCAYALDPHPQTPHAVLFIAIAPNGDIHVYDEIWTKASLEELALRIGEKRSLVPYFHYELCDPYAWNESQASQERWVDVLCRQGLNLQKASKQKTQGIIQANGLFVPNAKRRILIHPNCVTFITEIEEYYYDNENKPVDKDDHMMENFYRLVMFNDLRFIPKEQEHTYVPVAVGGDDYAVPFIT